MSSFGENYPVLRDTQEVHAGTCTGRVARLRPAAPVYSLGVTNPVTDFWEDEIGGLIQDGDGSPMTI